MIWEDTGLYLAAALLSLVLGYFIARAAWFEHIPALVRLPAWVATTLLSIIILWVILGVSALALAGHLTNITVTARSDYLDVLRYFWELGAEAGITAFLGVLAWVVHAVGRKALHLYRTRHEAGNPLNRDRPEKRWRVAFFISGLWVLGMFLFAMFSDFYGSRIRGGEINHLILMMIGPVLLGLGLFWSYDRFVR